MTADDYYPATNMTVRNANPVTMQMVANNNHLMTGFGFRDVNVKYLKAVLAPETGVVRRPNPNPQNTALGRAVITIPLKVNTSGNGAVFVYPKAFDLTSFAYQYFDPTFDPVSGDIPGLPGPTAISGPFNPSSTVINYGALVNMAV